jgi:hypothetical protein
VTPDRQVRQVPLVPQGIQVQQVVQEILDQLDQPVLQVLPVIPVQLEIQDLQGIQVRLVPGATGATGDFSGAYSSDSKTASYTLVLADAGKIIEMNLASANDLTVPLNSSQAFAVGSNITILQTGAGQTTLVATGGVTINATPGLKLRAQWSSATLIKRATDTWVAIGDLVS